MDSFMMPSDRHHQSNNHQRHNNNNNNNRGGVQNRGRGKPNNRGRGGNRGGYHGDNNRDQANNDCFFDQPFQMNDVGSNENQNDLFSEPRQENNRPDRRN